MAILPTNLILFIMKLIISVHRDGYGPEQVTNTMTVSELIETLEGFDEDALVFTSHDNGYTYGGINEWDFDEIEEDE